MSEVLVNQAGIPDKVCDSSATTLEGCMSMIGGVGCYAGCNGPVIGQCSGYRGACQQFYCSNHTINKLCAECGHKKLHDEESERVYNEYLDICKSVKVVGDVRKAVMMMFFFGFIGSIGAFAATRGSNVDSVRANGASALAYAIPFLVIGLVMLWFIWKKEKKASQFVEQTEVTRPGFKKFYATYQAKKAKEELMAIAGLAVFAVTAGVAVYQASKDNQLRRDIHDINKK
jgi:hypothetical protein